MKRGFKVMAAAFGAVLLLGAFAAGVALAADPPTTAPANPTDYYNVFMGKLAGILGVDQKALVDATAKARNQTIDQMVTDGRITSDQAQFMKDRAAQVQANGGPCGFGGPMGFGGGPMRGRFGGTSGTTPWGTPPWAATPTPTP